MGSHVSPDRVMRDYLRLTEAAGSPPGFDPVAMRGRLYLLRCPSCGGAKWKKQEDGTFRCDVQRTRFRKHSRKRVRYTKACGTPRPWQPAAVLKRHVQEGGSRLGGHSRVEDVAQLGLILRVLSEQQHRAFSVYVAKGSYAAALEHCLGEWPWGGWNDGVLRRLVKESRQLVEAKLERRARYDDPEERVA